MKLSTVIKTATLAIGLGLSALSFAGNIDVNANENDVAIKGFDTVAYFTQGQAVQGSTDYMAIHDGAIYQFSSAEHRDLFKQNPEKYAPQYGGFCAFGVTKERKFDTDPTAFRIVDNKLYLNYNAKVQEIWNADVNNFISSGNDLWSSLEGKTDAQLEAAE